MGAYQESGLDRARFIFLETFLSAFSPLLLCSFLLLLQTYLAIRQAAAWIRKWFATVITVAGLLSVSIASHV